MTLFTPLPKLSDAGFRTALYGGAVFMAPAGSAAHAVATHVRAEVERQMPGADLRTAHLTLEDATLRAHLAAARTACAQERSLRIALRALVEALGLDAGTYLFDTPRLRANLPHAHRKPEARAAYVAHRDTWYANPQSQVNLWLAPHACTEDVTFMFYPERFTVPVANDSAAFDYAVWRSTVGWQSGRAGAYPAALPGADLGAAVGFACGAADTLMFSAAQLHQSRGHDGPLLRLSLELRLVHVGDHARGLGAPNADNAARGDATTDYLPLSRWLAVP